MALTEATWRKADRLLKAGTPLRQVGRHLGVAYTSLRKEIARRTKTASKWYKPKGVAPAADAPQPAEVPTDSTPRGEPDRVFREAEDGTATLSLHTDRPIKTLADLCRAAEVDPAVWRVESWECSAWTVPMKVKGEGRAKVGIQTQQYRVKARLRRVVSRAVGAALDLIAERMRAHAFRYPPAPAVRGKGEPHLAVVGLFDAHFGKLCWDKETGESYDLKKAESIYANAVEDMVAEAGGRRVERFLLPVGSDFYHIDNSRNTTYNGTPQDVDERYHKVIATGELAVIRAVERLMAVAPVDVVWVPGNHDPTTSYHLSRTVAAWFSKCGRVRVDNGPSPRKYFHWNSTLLGLTHGNEEKPDKLPGLMATERPAEWAGSRCREWLLGHHHRSRQWVTQPVDTHEGTVVRVLRSIAGTDAWHHRKGFIHSGPLSRAAEMYLYGRDRGYAGHAVVPAREA